MIRSRQALLDALTCGETIALLTDYAGAQTPHWCIASTGEAVGGSAFAAAKARGELAPVQLDLTGEPMQYAHAAPQP